MVHCNRKNPTNKHCGPCPDKPSFTCFIEVYSADANGWTLRFTGSIAGSNNPLIVKATLATVSTSPPYTREFIYDPGEEEVEEFVTFTWGELLDQDTIGLTLESNTGATEQCSVQVPQNGNIVCQSFSIGNFLENPLRRVVQYWVQDIAVGITKIELVPTGQVIEFDPPTSSASGQFEVPLPLDTDEVCLLVTNSLGQVGGCGCIDWYCCDAAANYICSVDCNFPSATTTRTFTNPNAAGSWQYVEEFTLPDLSQELIIPIQQPCAIGPDVGVYAVIRQGSVKVTRTEFDSFGAVVEVLEANYTGDIYINPTFIAPSVPITTNLPWVRTDPAPDGMPGSTPVSLVFDDGNYGNVGSCRPAEGPTPNIYKFRPQTTQKPEGVWIEGYQGPNEDVPQYGNYL